MRIQDPGSRIQSALALLALALALAGCSGSPKRGGYYQDDGPGRPPPVRLEQTADAKPRVEPLSAGANSPYTALGRKYVPFTTLRPYRERGLGSWYGRKFHGQRTSSGERYDMYAMTAAHRILPIPSYARVTHVGSGKSVIVRINDRGPFHSGRMIDLSYAAADKLGYIGAGSALVEVEAITPENMSNAGRRESRPVEAAPVVEARPSDVAIPIAAEANGVYLQLGAFSARENAENLRSRIERQSGWLGIEIREKAGLFHVRLGPYRGRAEASGVADQIRESLEIKPIVVER
ncbi:MAG TPA: septal ring lytic transglycosylase RlpA family protein [Burkholderiales bacterium]